MGSILCLLGAQSSVSPCPEAMWLSLPLCCHCGMRDETQIHPARRGSRGAQPAVLPWSARTSPGWNWGTQPCLPARGSTVGQPCRQQKHSGVDGGHTQPRCFPLPPAIPSLFGPGISCCSKRGGALPFSSVFFLRADILAGLVPTKNPRGFCLF